MESLWHSFLMVAISEMGDKTQILSLILTLRFKQPWTIMSAILLATLFNHLGATGVGVLLANQIPEIWLKYILALVFIGFGLWILKPDSDEGLDKNYAKSAFWTTLVVFFLAEMGDKTQLATIALGARYKSVWLVTMGSTAGMLLTNGVSVFGGERLVKVIPMNYVRFTACLMFLIFGVLVLPIWS